MSIQESKPDLNIEDDNQNSVHIPIDSETLKAISLDDNLKDEVPPIKDDDDNVTGENNKPKHRSCCGSLWSFLKFLIFDVKWGYVIYHVGLAVASMYVLTKSIIMFFQDPLSPEFLRRAGTGVFVFFLSIAGSIGLTSGEHRLWAHHCYKAKLPLRILLMIMATSVAESTIYFFVKHHRAHHVFLDTHADPQNVKRGFWFSQIGWRLVRARPEYREKVKTLQYTDVLSDPVVKFQKIFFVPLVLIFAFIIPTLIPYYCWGENLLDSFLAAGCGKSFAVITVHGMLGSVSHMYGQRPYSKKVSARENLLMSIIASGEGWHNFHHIFPYDYALSEFGQKFNVGKLFIDLMALTGQAYGMRRASPEYIDKMKNQNLPPVLEFD
ncbi:stearoyl-CoA desaturase 5-like [Brevipalpus obovatus]|uniref:stearoyl-CoA desaturase 5-like n=1 Tax=Brevipalpus obovatus TaxID=246614 RepID=UPI003D9EC454